MAPIPDGMPSLLNSLNVSVTKSALILLPLTVVAVALASLLAIQYPVSTPKPSTLNPPGI